MRDFFAFFKYFGEMTVEFFSYLWVSILIAVVVIIAVQLIKKAPRALKITVSILAGMYLMLMFLGILLTSSIVYSDDHVTVCKYKKYNIQYECPVGWKLDSPWNIIEREESRIQDSIPGIVTIGNKESDFGVKYLHNVKTTKGYSGDAPDYHYDTIYVKMEVGDLEFVSIENPSRITYHDPGFNTAPMYIGDIERMLKTLQKIK